ncbi:MAG: prepilin-type N-terminal cleavage/methylation domain-containing protein [Acidobacteriota bacterium]
MKQRSAEGFSLIELMIATAVLLVVMSTGLSFFSRSQVVYTNERITLDMVQDMRTVFDRFTNEIRMAGSGLPAPRGVIEGSPTTLIVRGDFNNIGTIITSVSPITASGATATIPVGTTARFVAGQTISLINNLTGISALAKITAVDSAAKTIKVDKDDLFPIESGAQLTDNPGTNSFPAGAIINVIERRTYSIIMSGADKGAITRTVIYENTQTAGTTIQSAEIIARNVLDESGNPGLTFTYYKPDGTSAGLDAAGNVIPSEAVKVHIDLKARSANRDLQTGKYRTFAYSALVQVRGQYVPRVGF